MRGYSSYLNLRLTFHDMGAYTPPRLMAAVRHTAAEPSAGE